MPETQQRIFKCPHCEEEITEVKYECHSSGSEWGRAAINGDGNFQDHETDDSETSDTYDYEYLCPECDHNICEEDLMNDEDEENDNNEENEGARINGTINANSYMQAPEQTIINEDNQKVTNNKTKESEKIRNLISRREVNINQINENTIFCPKCQKQNSIIENNVLTRTQRMIGKKENKIEKNIVCVHCGVEINIEIKEHNKNWQSL